MTTPKRYKNLIAHLNEVGINTHLNGNNDWQLVCSAGKFWKGPFSSNSIWLLKSKSAEHGWIIATWSPIHYSIPDGVDIVGLCKDLIGSSRTTIYEIPHEIMKHYGLTEINDEAQLPPELQDDDDVG